MASAIEASQLLGKGERKISEQRLRAHIKDSHPARWFIGESFKHECEEVARETSTSFLHRKHEEGMSNSSRFFSPEAGVIRDGRSILWPEDFDHIMRLSAQTCYRLMKLERDAIKKQQRRRAAKSKLHCQRPQTDEENCLVQLSGDNGRTISPQPQTQHRTSSGRNQRAKGDADPNNEDTENTDGLVDLQETQQPEQRHLAILDNLERPYNFDGSTQLIQQWARHLEWTLKWYTAQLEHIKSGHGDSTRKVKELVRFGTMTKQALADFAASKALDASQAEKDKADLLEMIRK